MVVDRGGRLLTLQLSKSSGAPVLDDTGAEMIRRAAPLPPVPPEIPGEAVELEVALALFPR
jgi:protein TonB